MNVLDPSDGEPLNDGELTRAHDKIAVVRGPSTTESSARTMVRVYVMSNLTDRPVERCDLRSAPNTRIESPTWTPDGKRLAWSERSGVWTTGIASGAPTARRIRGGWSGAARSPTSGPRACPSASAGARAARG